MMNPSFGTMLLEAKQEDIRRQVERRRAEGLADGPADPRDHRWVAVAAEPRTRLPVSRSRALVRLSNRFGFGREELVSLIRSFR